jgi:TolB-like protein
MAEGKTIDEIKIGDSAKISNTITETVIHDFAKVQHFVLGRRSRQRI